jgi:hypothetical protein
MKVAEKKVLKGMRKWPLAMPAKSKRGLGMEAPAKIAQNPYFYILSKMKIFIFSVSVSYAFLFNSTIS